MKTPTPLDNLRFAWMHHALEIDQHKVASTFGVNSGRVNEACRAIAYAMADPKKFIALVEMGGKPETVEAVDKALQGGVLTTNEENDDVLHDRIDSVAARFHHRVDVSRPDTAPDMAPGKADKV